MPKATRQELWVQPRLRGFVITSDPRNPPSRVGEFLPYTAGWRWRVQGRRSVAVPGSIGIRPIDDVVLRLHSRRELGVSTCALDRDLSRRVREGQVNFTFRQPDLMSRWSLVTILAGAVLAMVLAYVYRFPLIAAFTGALLLNVPHALRVWGMNARAVRLAGGTIEVDRRDGRTARYPFRAVRRVGVRRYAYAIEFADATSLRFHVARHARSVFRALLRAVDPAAVEWTDDGAGSPWYAIRTALAAACVVGIIVHLKLNPPTGLFVENWSLLSAAYVAAIVFTLAYAAKTMIVRATRLERRWRRRRYSGREAAGRRAPRELALVPFEQAA